ncbi:hypothetical protein DFJ74DRAFT_713260 [Hyaloraphidium curvatum]|nr:hypothetical protein DFJ74DRAFT_713260 [Hyaloraphidium curvatum]
MDDPGGTLLCGLTASDLALLQPSALPAPAPPWKPRAPSFPTAARRDPLDRKRVLAALRDRPLIRAVVRLRLAVDPLFAAWWSRAVVLPACSVPLLAVPWVFGGQAYGTRELVTATAALCLNLVAGVVMTVRIDITRRLRIAGSSGDKVSAMGDLALITRYMERAASAGDAVGQGKFAAAELGQESSPSEGPDVLARIGASPLLAHDDSDPACSCSRNSCAGELPTRALWSSTLRTSVALVVRFAAYGLLLRYYTPLVALGAENWTHAWSAVFAALRILLDVVMWIPIHSLAFGPYPPRAAALEARLQRRAVRLSVIELVESLDGPQSSPDGDGGDAPDPAYLSMHRLLAPNWQRRFHSVRLQQSNRSLLLALELLYGLIYAAGSSCLPAWVLLGILIDIVQIVDDLVAVARYNDGVGALLDLYRLALAEVRRLRVHRPREDVLAAHDAALSGLIGQDGNRATFLGVRVDYAAVRVFVVTLLTVFGVAWGVLKGVGLAVTLESVCPGGGAG